MDLKLKFNKARKNMQQDFNYRLAFKTTDFRSGIKTEILLKDIILSVGFCEYSENLQNDFLHSMLDAIENYDKSLIEE